MNGGHYLYMQLSQKSSSSSSDQKYYRWIIIMRQLVAKLTDLSFERRGKKENIIICAHLTTLDAYWGAYCTE